MDYRELIERLRYEGYDVSRNEAADAIESLLAENERLKHNLATTEQTMREYQELAAKRLEEIDKYRDAPVVGYATTNEEGDQAMLFFDEQEARQYSGDGEPIKLIVKPGEEECEDSDGRMAQMCSMEEQWWC